MSDMRRFLVAVIIGVIVVSGVHVRAVFADPADNNLSQTRLEGIGRSCVSAQGQIQRIQVSDKVTRTNRGSNYAALIKLMQALDKRAADDNFDTTNLSLTAAAAEAKLQQFIDDYIRYDNAVDGVVRMSCAAQPAVFYAALTQVRGLRVQLTNDIRGLDEVVAQYQGHVSELTTKVTARSHGGAS